MRVDGSASRAAARVRAHQLVELSFPEPVAAVPQPEALPVTILHEDAELLVVDKPAGLVVHPGAGRSSGTLVNALLHQVRDLSGVGGVLRPGIVHRLDRGTSGLIVVAKSDHAHRALAAQFAARGVEKEYLAVVLGIPSPARGEIVRPIGRHPVERKRMAVRPDGRAARTGYAVEEGFDGAALVRLRLHTGRTHQIRVHLAAIGHPIVGDATYGGSREPSSERGATRAALRAFPRPALHAARLVFDHPGTGRRMAFEAPLPADLTSLLSKLRAAPRDAR